MSDPTKDTAEPAKPKRWRKLRFLAWVAVSSVVLLEIAMRALDPLGVEYHWAMRRYVSHLVPNADYSYIHEPGYRDRLQGVDVSINSEGLRWPEFALQKPEGTLRVMILGDSIVFGWGARLEATFPMLIQDALRDDGLQAEVIAAGVCSWNTRSEYEFIKARGMQYQPDVLLLVVYSNDIDPHPTGANQVAITEEAPQVSAVRRLVRWMGRHSYLVATVLAIRGKFVAGQRSPELYNDNSRLWQNGREALEQLIQLCRDRGVCLAAYLDGDSRLPFAQACFERYGGVLHAAGVPFVEATPDLYHPRLCNSWVDGHANAARHEIVASKLLEMLKPMVRDRASASVPAERE